MKKRYLFFGIIFLLVAALFIQSKNNVSGKIASKNEPIKIIPKNPYLEKFLSEYDSIIQTTVGETPGAAVVIVRGDSIIYSKGFGIASIKTGDSVKLNTVFRIGSLSKGFASILTGVISQEDSLNFDDRVIDYFPDFKLKTKQQTDSLTLRHVLSHSTGLIYQAYTTLIEDGVPLEQMLESLQDVDLIGKPGEYYSYQNVGYSAIEKILENHTGFAYTDLLSRKLFNPLGMNNASSTYEDIIIKNSVAKPHARGKNGWFELSISDNYYNTKAAGGINASIIDMGQWLKAMLGHKSDIIYPSTLDQIFSPQIRTFVRYKYFRSWPKVKKTYYGLGWRVVENDNDKVIYHGGFVNNYSSKIALIPSEDVGICVLTNSSNSFVRKTVPEFLDVYDKYREEIKSWESLQKVDSILTQL